MSSSLDRKMEAAARRAAEERKTDAMSPEQFRGAHANPDGTTTGVLPKPPARPVPAPTKTWLWNPPAGWYEADKPEMIYETVGDVKPLDDLSNVKATRTTIGKTHVDKDAPAVSPASDPLMKPKRQQWVRVLIDHFIDDNEPQPRTVFKTTDNQPPLDDMTNVRAVVAPGQVIEVWDGGFRVNTEPPLQRPPIGLVPRYLVAEQRLRDIDLAIARYTRVNKPIPTEWEAERLELVEFERKRQNGRGDLPLHSAMQVLREAIRTDPDQAKLWHRHVVDAVHEQVGGRDDANTIENAIKVAAHFMHQVFGVDLDSELNRVPVAQARKGEFDEAPASPREHWPEMNRRGLWPNNQPIAELVDFVATELPSGNFGQRAAQSGLQSPQPLETSMGSNLGKSSNELHREIDGATGNRINEAINPRARLARQEAEAGLEQTNTSRAAPAPAPASGGTMSQADFTAGSRPRSTPPAELLKKHDSR